MLSSLCPPRRCCPPSLPPTSANLDVRHSAYSAVEGEWNLKMPLTIFVLLTIGTLTLLILFLLKFFMMQTDGALKQDCGDLTLTLEKRCHFRYEIENYFSCSHLARRDCDYHMIILVFRDENEITYCCSHVSRRDRDLWKSFLVVEREKMKLTLVENFRDQEFSLTSGLITLMNSLNWFGGSAREFGLGVLSQFLAKPQICIFI